MKRALLLLGTLVAGSGVGGGAAWGVVRLAGSVPSATVESASDEPPAFVPMELLVPLVTDDGHLAAYATLKLQLQVEQESAEAVTARLPLVQHAINLQTYRAPLGTGADGRLPDLGAIRRLVQQSSDQVLGKDQVRQVAIVEART